MKNKKQCKMSNATVIAEFLADERLWSNVYQYIACPNSLLPCVYKGTSHPACDICKHSWLKNLYTQGMAVHKTEITAEDKIKLREWEQLNIESLPIVKAGKTKHYKSK